MRKKSLQCLQPTPVRADWFLELQDALIKAEAVMDDAKFDNL